MIKRLGRQTRFLENAPVILSWAAVGGPKEGEGPLGHAFDRLSEDAYFGQSSWEKAEIKLLQDCFSLASDKAKLPPSALDCVLAGDLLNQCVSTAFAMKDSALPYFGLYGACSTMAEGLSLAALLLSGGAATRCAVLTGSHFCSAERQYRFPLEYGGQRTPTSQWTVTGGGAVLLGTGEGDIRLTHVTTGRIVDAGVADASHMGGAMAPAAFDTLAAHFQETGRKPEDYDAIFTGDLGALGHDLLEELFHRQGVELGARYTDCGVLIYDRQRQDVGVGGSGCGCCASVLAAYILPGLREGRWRRVLFAATGALMSPTSSQQGCSIPGICHAVALERMG